METDAIKEKTKAFLARYLRKEVDSSQDLFATGLVNSLFAMQLVLFLEKEFEIKVENVDLDLDNFRAIDAIAAFVVRKTAGAAASST